MRIGWDFVSDASNVENMLTFLSQYIILNVVRASAALQQQPIKSVKHEPDGKIEFLCKDRNIYVT